MADTSETRTFDEIVSTTLDAYMPTLTDNIFKTNAAFYEFKRKGGYVPAGGGVQIVEPLLYGKNLTVKSYSRYDTIDTTPQEGITSALFPWAQVAGSVTIDGLTQWQNSGRHQVINLLAAKLSQLESSMQEKFSEYFFGTGKYNASQTTKDPAGLQALVPESPSSYDAGGIDASVETWWKNKVKGNGGSSWSWLQTLDSGDSEATGPAAMRQLYNNCSKGSGGPPDLILASQYFFENYEAYLMPFKRFQDDAAAQAGFTNLKYRNATLYWDEQFASANCTSPGSTCGAYMLNLKTIKLRYSPSHNFKRTPFVKPVNQDAMTCLVLWYGNMTMNNRRKNGVMVDANVTDVT